MLQATCGGQRTKQEPYTDSVFAGFGDRTHAGAIQKLSLLVSEIELKVTDLTPSTFTLCAVALNFLNLLFIVFVAVPIWF